jgi:hypothetical protein
MDSIAATELGPRVNFARLLLRGGGCGASTANKVAPAPGLLVALGTESTATPVRGKIHKSMSGSVKSGDVLIGEAKRGGRIELYERWHAASDLAFDAASGRIHAQLEQDGKRPIPLLVTPDAQLSEGWHVQPLDGKAAGTFVGLAADGRSLLLRVDNTDEEVAVDTPWTPASFR